MQRIKNINGIFATPHENDEYLKIKKVWLFGSLAKGSEDPNDVDIFIELHGFIPDSFERYDKVKSHERKFRRKKRRKIKGMSIIQYHGCFKLDKKSAYYREFGVPKIVNSVESLRHYLSKSIPSASIHFVHDDLIFSELDVKHMLFPRCDFDYESILTNNYKRKYKNQRKLP